MNHIHTILLSFCLAVNTALAQTSPNPVGGTQPTVTTKTDSLSWLIQGPKNAMAVSIAVDQRDPRELPRRESRPRSAQMRLTLR